MGDFGKSRWGRGEGVKGTGVGRSGLMTGDLECGVRLCPGVGGGGIVVALGFCMQVDLWGRRGLLDRCLFHSGRDG